MDMMGALDKLDRSAVSHGSRRFADQELLGFIDSLGPTGWNRRINLVLRVERGGVPAGIAQWLARRPWVTGESFVGKESWRQRIIEVVRGASPPGRIAVAPFAFPGFVRAVGEWNDARASMSPPFVWIRGR
jgi:hypothetical protein